MTPRQRIIWSALHVPAVLARSLGLAPTRAGSHRLLPTTSRIAACIMDRKTVTRLLFLGAALLLAPVVCANGPDAGNTKEFFAFLDRTLPARGSIEATYTLSPEGSRYVYAYDIETGSWYWASHSGAGGCFAPDGPVYAAGVAQNAGAPGGELVEVKDGPFSGRPSLDNSVEPFFPTVFLLDVARRNLGPTLLEPRAGGGYRAVFRFPQGERVFIGRPVVGALPERNVSVEVDRRGRVTSITDEGRERPREYTYSPLGPEKMPVAEHSIDLATGEIAFKLESVRFFPEGAPHLFTPDAVNALLRSLREIERERKQERQPRPSATRAAAVPEPSPAGGYRPMWWFIVAGAGIIGAAVVAVLRRG